MGMLSFRARKTAVCGCGTFARTGRVVQKHELAAQAFTVALDPSGTRVAVATFDGETQLLDFKTLNLIRRTRAAGGLPSGIAFSPDSATLAVLAQHEPLRLYSSAEHPLEIPVPDRSSNDRISFSPNGRLIAIGDPLALIVVDVIRRTVVARRPHKTPLRNIAFLDDSTVLTSSLGGDLCRWSLRDEREQTCVPMHAGELHQIAISPDHQYGAVRGFHQVKIFNPATLGIIASLPDHGQCGSLCFLAGGRTLLIGDEFDATLSLANQLVAPHGPAGNRLDLRGGGFVGRLSACRRER